MTARGLQASGRDRVLLLNLLLNCVQEQGALTPACPRAFSQSAGSDFPPPTRHKAGGCGKSDPSLLECKTGKRGSGHQQQTDRANKDWEETEQARTKNQKGTTAEGEFKGRQHGQRGTRRRRRRPAGSRRGERGGAESDWRGGGGAA